MAAAAATTATLLIAAHASAQERAYEKVSPNEKDGVDITNGLNRAAAAGGAVTYASPGAFAGSQGGGLGNQYLSERTPNGWTVEPIAPPLDPAPGLAVSQYWDFAADLKTAVYQTGDPPVGGATPGTQNLYRRNADGTVDLLTDGQPAPGTFPPAIGYAGGSADLGIVAFDFEDELAVTGGPVPPEDQDNAYATDGDELRLVSVLPNGEPVADGATIGGRDSDLGEYNAVSDDGSRIFWSTASNPVEVYMRTDPTSASAATVWVSESQRTSPDPAGPLPTRYRYATPDGSFVYFSSAEKLTDDATATAGREDLYRYDVATGELEDLTTGDPDGAGIQGVLGVSDNGQRVYFAATGDLAPGATDGELNLYLLDGTETRFIANLDPSDDDDRNWATTYNNNGPQYKTSRVSADGELLLFSSEHQQGSFDNAGTAQLYLYEASSGSLTCVSCNPNGAPPSGDAQLLGNIGSGLGIAGLPYAERRNLLADGRVIFGSPDPLLPSEDSNNAYDVYLWDDGELELISSGSSSDDSVFVDASADGTDIFFLTRAQLVGIDRDNIVDLYDARVGDGIAAQNPPPPAPPCEGEDCKPRTTQPIEGPTPGTAMVDGSGEDRSEPRTCSRLQRKADRLRKKMTRSRRKARQLRRSARRASGSKQRRLERKAERAKRNAKQAKAQAKRARRQGKRCGRKRVR